MALRCTVCGEDFSLPLEEELMLWANQEWEPLACGETCGNYLLSYAQTDFYEERDVYHERVLAWLDLG